MPPDLRQLRQDLARALPSERDRLKRRLSGIQRAAREGKPVEHALAKLTEAVANAVTRAERRRALKPRIIYPADLPVSERAHEIAQAIRDNQVIVLCGETGSGKSTQLPKICLDIGRGVDGQIAHTQPRRLAARAIASRLADELRLPLGSGVGYKFRFTDASGPDALIKVMTDGILLAETQTDRDLRQYDTIIIDEAHERSLNIDFLLGYLRQLLPKRPDLKIIITSATIDTDRFSEHFEGAPIIEVSGRTYPVEVRYRPFDAGAKADADDDAQPVRDLPAAICDAADELLREHLGDVLVFLPGEREIREAAHELRKRATGAEILPLYARLSTEEQQRIFKPGPGAKRIVLSTNVAETSLTVPGIRSVIDTGLARVSRFSRRGMIQRLEVEAISRASADQRKGRCGRVGPGVCIRLYSEDDFLKRSEFTDPEIQRSNLAGVILRMKALRLGKVEDFPFVEAPDPRSVREGYRALLELHAVDEEGEITDLGRRLARLPVDPRIARMIVEAGDRGCLRDVLTIAAFLSVQDPRERPADKRDAADEAHARFADENSDFLSILTLWNESRERERKLNQRQHRKWCKDNFLSYMRLREWRDVRKQIDELAHEIDLRAPDKPAHPDEIHKSLLVGLLSNVGRKGEKHEYEAPHGVRFNIFPGSALFETKPQWVMAAELVRTTRLYARTVGAIQPEWIEKAAAHLVRRTHHEPFWESRRARVNAWEKVSLYGLEVIPRRKVHYGPINPEFCRETFIHRALVEGDYRTAAPHDRHNRRQIEQIEKMEARLRRKDLLASPQHRFDFFDRRVPKGIYSGERFDQWRINAEKKDPRLLFYTREDLLNARPEAATLEQFPERASLAGASAPIEYAFDPGAPDDGVTVTIPAETLATLDPAACDWIVPGIMHEKIVSLVRGLDKEHRRLIGPAGDFAEQFLASDPPRNVPLTRAIGDVLARRTGTRIDDDAWGKVELPAHLRPLLRVVNDAGEEVAASRDLAALRRDVASRMGTDAGVVTSAELDRDGLTDWPEGPLPRSTTLRRRGAILTVYPALIDQGGSVGVRAMDDESASALAHREGVLRLATIVARSDMKGALQATPRLDEIRILHAPFGPAKAADAGLIRRIAERAYLHGLALAEEPRTKDDFEAMLSRGWHELATAALHAGDVALRTLELAQQITLELERRRPPAWDGAVSDLRAQLDAMIYPGFLEQTPARVSDNLPRYLRAMLARIERLGAGAIERDNDLMRDLGALLARFVRLSEASPADTVWQERMREVRWMFEELRVSMFAQNIGARDGISPKRMSKVLESLERDPRVASLLTAS